MKTRSRFALWFLLACPGFLRAQSSAATGVPDPFPEYAGFAQPRVEAEDSKEVRAAEAAIAAERWAEAAALLDHLLGPKEKAGAAPFPRIDEAGDRFVTNDGIHFENVASRVKRIIEELPPAGLDAWQKRRGEAGGEEKAISAPAASLDAAHDAEWPCTLGRPDRAALEIPQGSEWRPGGYALWIHNLTKVRKLESGTPAKNLYYAFTPMQLVSSGDLVIGRSHQDIVALDRVKGEVRWRVESELPQNEQSHQDGRSSGFDSWRYFSDIGGWSLAVIPGQRDIVIITSKSGRGRVVNKKLEFQRNVLRAHDALTGAFKWRRGGPEDPEEALRTLTFAAPPVLAGAKRDLLVVPATSDDGYVVAGLTYSGGLIWVKKLYKYIPEKFELIDESFGLGASLAAKDGVVVGAPGQGLIFALNERGETLWELKYPSGVRQNPNDPRWAPGHPIIAGGKVVAAPFDGDSLLAIDLKTGAPAWTKRFLSGYHALLGADPTRAYVIDSTGRVTAFSTADGSTAWTSEELGAPAGRAFVTANRVYAAVKRAVVLLDVSSGKVVKKCRLWDERLPEPAPGNLFLSRGDLYLGAPWGFAKLEPYEVTLASLDSLGIREQLLRKAMISHAMQNYEEALEALKQALASTRDEAARETLRSQLLQVSQEAAASTKDLKFVRRVLEEPDLVPTKAHRTAFILRSGEMLEKEAPAEAARLYREILSGPVLGDMVASPEGALVDVQVYVSDALRGLVRARKAESIPEEEDKVVEAITGALAEDAGADHLTAIALRQSHAAAAAAASAHLSRSAEDAGNFTTAANHIERMLDDDPALAEAPELREHLMALRRRARAGASTPEAPFDESDLKAQWVRRFYGKSAGAELVSMAEGSDPLPGMLIAKDSTVALLDDNGAVVWKHKMDGLPDLTEARKRVQGVLVEPALAHQTDERVLVFTANGILGINGLGSDTRSARVWFPLEHPLAQFAAPPASQSGSKAKAAAKITVSDNSNFFARVSFDQRGNPCLVEPEGSVTILERSTGRHFYSERVRERATAGPPVRTDNVVSFESAKPPGVVLHDIRTHAVSVVPTPATPWRAIVVPGIALVIDSAAGIQVRELILRPKEAEGDPTGVRALWRDAKPRGALSLVHADAVQVIAVESGGRLVSRSIRSGRHRWSVPFPDGLSPVTVYEVPEDDGGAGDIVMVASRGSDPEDGRGVLGQRVAQDLTLVRVSLAGEKRWELSIAEGGIVYADARVIVDRDHWVILFNHKGTEWKTRAVALDVAKGAVRGLFDLPLESKPNYPPPRVLVTQSGIAVGNMGAWALFVPERAAAK